MNSIAKTSIDPTIQFSTLTIDGTDYKLAYSFNSIAIAEHEAKTNLLEGLLNLSSLNASQLRGLLYGSMLLAQPKTSIHEAGSLIRLDTIGPVTQAIAEAYSLSLPPSKKNETDLPTDEPKQ